MPGAPSIYNLEVSTLGPFYGPQTLQEFYGEQIIIFFLSPSYYLFLFEFMCFYRPQLHEIYVTLAALDRDLGPPQYDLPRPLPLRLLPSIEHHQHQSQFDHHGRQRGKDFHPGIRHSQPNVDSQGLYQCKDKVHF